MSLDYKKPLPTLSDENRQFWDACKKGELQMQKCTDCNHIRYPIGPVCTKCLSSNFVWEKLSGKGKVFNSIIFHQMYNKDFADGLPYNVVMIQLDEGPRMFSNLVGIENDKIKINMPVQLVIEKATDEISIPKFRPVE